jgi:hypothetical protein
MGCTSVRPSISASPPSSASASPAPSLPPARCDTQTPDYWKAFETTGPGGSPVPIPVTLTCENAVAAAWFTIGEPPGVASVVFGFGAWCDFEPGCPALPPNVGHVVFHFEGGSTVVASVRADDVGRVTVDDTTTVQTHPPSS